MRKQIWRGSVTSPGSFCWLPGHRSVAQASHRNVPPLPLPLLRGTLKEGSYTLLLGGQGIWIRYFESFAWEICHFSLIYLFNHLYQYALIDVYFILWVIIHYYFVLFKLLWLWPLSTLSTGPSVPAHQCMCAV